MTVQTFILTALNPALALLPPRMDRPEARAMMVAIALQESDLASRRQAKGGPARSYLQFERAGVQAVLTHHASGTLARELCIALDIRYTAAGVHRAIEFHDVLAVCFGRLLLWTLPETLPSEDETDRAYRQYFMAWRPGKPRPDDWPNNWTLAWYGIKGDS